MVQQTEFKRLQSELGWTNKKIAHQLAVSVSTVDKWRAGNPEAPNVVNWLLMTWDAGAKRCGIENATPVWAGDHWEYL